MPSTPRKSTARDKGEAAPLEALLQQLIDLQQEQREQLRDLNAAVACLYKVRDGLFTFNFAGEDYTFYLPDLPYDFIQQAIVLNNRFFEAGLLEQVRSRFMHHGMQVVEVGGNLGNHAIYFSKVAKASSVVSFEPQPHLCAVFRRNLELNHVQNVTLISALCGAAQGQGQIKGLALNNLGATRFEALPEGSSTPPPQQAPTPQQSGICGGYPVVTLDEEIKAGCDFLKIDAEGMEEEVIKGALQLVGRCHPVIMVELWNEEHVKNFARHLLPLGYGQYLRYGAYDYIFPPQQRPEL